MDNKSFSLISSAVVVNENGSINAEATKQKFEDAVLTDAQEQVNAFKDKVSEKAAKTLAAFTTLLAEYTIDREAWGGVIESTAKTVAAKYVAATITKIHKDPFIMLIVSELNQQGKVDITNMASVTDKVTSFVDTCPWIVIKPGKGGGITFPNGIPQ